MTAHWWSCIYYSQGSSAVSFQTLLPLEMERVGNPLHQKGTWGGEKRGESHVLPVPSQWKTQVQGPSGNQMK